MLLGFDRDRLDFMIKNKSKGTLTIDDFTTLVNAVSYLLILVERECKVGD